MIVNVDELAALEDRACTGKTKYGPKAARNIAASLRLHGEQVQPYRCPFCAPCWHVGHSMSWEGLKKMAEAIRYMNQIDPRAPAMVDDERFWSKVEKAEGCWLWRGAIKSNGYGHLYRGGVNHQAHRYAYELVVGPIPAGHVIDHLCRVRNCVNPAHLEAVTQAVNLDRGFDVGDAGAAFQRDKTHCPHGHPYNETNTSIVRGQRECKACRRERAREDRARKRPA